MLKVPLQFNADETAFIVKRRNSITLSKTINLAYVIKTTERYK